MSDPWRECRPVMTATADRIRNTRRRAGHTLGDLAGRIGTDVPTLSRIENQTMIPSPVMAHQLAVYLLQHAVTPADPFPAHARHTDPVSSHIVVKSLAENYSVRARLTAALRTWEDGALFTDDDLWRALNKSIARSSVARFRLWAERDGELFRVGTRDCRLGRRLHFTTDPTSHHIPRNRQPLGG